MQKQISLLDQIREISPMSIEPITDADRDKLKQNAVAIKLHKQLIEIYGLKSPYVCGNCKFFMVFNRGSRNQFYKCGKAKIKGHTKTDWRYKWEACGQFIFNPDA